MGSNSTGEPLGESQEWLRLIHGYSAPIICVAGFVGNVIGSVVLMDMELRAPITILMTGLAASNALTLIMYIPFAMMLLNITRHDRPQSRVAYLVMSVISHVIMNTSAISNWLIVTIAIYMLAVLQRVCDPFKTITTSRARYINCFVYFVVTAMCIPNFHDVLAEPDQVSANVTVWYLGVGYTTGERSLLNDFNIVVNSVLMRLIPCVVLTIVVFTVVKDMRQAVKVSRQLPIVDTEEATRWKSNRIHTLIITRILLMVLIIFMATEFSNGLLMLLAYGIRQFLTLYTKLGHVLATLALINYGVTFLLYSFMSFQFREACRQASCHQLRGSNYS